MSQRSNARWKAPLGNMRRRREHGALRVNKLTAVQQLIETLDIRDEAVAGRHGLIPIRRYTPDSELLGKLVWIHGGAFSYGGLDQLESHAVAAAIAHSGVEVITVDYRRVPQWNPLRDPRIPLPAGIRFPEPLDDVSDVFDIAQREHEKVVLGGASAGACLATAAAIRRRDERVSPPYGLVLAYGTFHAELPPMSPALALRVRGHHGILQFRPSTVRRMNLNYAGSEEAMKDPMAFPGGHNPHGLPRTLLINADRDTLRASGEAFFQQLLEAGVDTTHEVIADSTHGFLDRPQTPTFSHGITSITTWLSRIW